MRPFWPLAWLLTWTTYGTWLQGDDRGSWDRKAESPIPKFVKPNIRFEALRRSQLKHEPTLITPPMRRVIRETLEEHTRFRGWRMLAQNIRTNHVHVVVNNATDNPLRMLQALKARTTRMLRETGMVEADRTVWTSKGSHTWLLDEEEVQNAIRYVLQGQGDPLPEE